MLRLTALDRTKIAADLFAGNSGPQLPEIIARTHPEIAAHLLRLIDRARRRQQ